MKNLFFVLVMFSACQAPSGPTNELMTSGPEVDQAKKYFEQWVAADWTAFRAGYADTAISVHNSTEFSADSVVSFHRVRRANYDKVEFRTDAIEVAKYEESGGGQTWAHIWGAITLTVKGTGKIVEVPVHVASQLAGGKIAREYLYYNTAGIIQALQEANALEAAATTAK